MGALTSDRPSADASITFCSVPAFVSSGAGMMRYSELVDSQIAAIDLKNYKAFTIAVSIALAALQVKALKGEQAKDWQRAESAIVVTAHGCESGEKYIHTSSRSEFLRLQIAVARPAKLAKIF
jgi:hypothetical protein